MYAYSNRVFDASVEELTEKYAVIGFDRAGSPLEIMYNQIDDNTISIFHAMKARKSFVQLLNSQEKTYGKNDRRRSLDA